VKRGSEGMEFLAAVLKLVGLVIILSEMMRFAKDLDSVEITDFLTIGLVSMAVGIVMSKRKAKNVPVTESNGKEDLKERAEEETEKEKPKKSKSKEVEDVDCKFFDEGECEITGTKVPCSKDDCGFYKMMEANELKHEEELPGFGR